MARPSQLPTQESTLLEQMMEKEELRYALAVANRVVVEVLVSLLTEEIQSALGMAMALTLGDHIPFMERFLL